MHGIIITYTSHVTVLRWGSSLYTSHVTILRWGSSLCLHLTLPYWGGDRTEVGIIIMYISRYRTEVGIIIMYISRYRTEVGIIIMSASHITVLRWGSSLCTSHWGGNLYYVTSYITMLRWRSSLKNILHYCVEGDLYYVNILHYRVKAVIIITSPSGVRIIITYYITKLRERSSWYFYVTVL